MRSQCLLQNTLSCQLNEHEISGDENARNLTVNMLVQMNIAENCR